MTVTRQFGRGALQTPSLGLVEVGSIYSHSKRGRGIVLDASSREFAREAKKEEKKK